MSIACEVGSCERRRGIVKSALKPKPLQAFRMLAGAFLYAVALLDKTPVRDYTDNNENPA